MIDIFTILLSHGLILLAAWKLLFRDDLDHEAPAKAPAPRPWLKPAAPAAATDEPAADA
ncbi:MAG: hypothetical protein JY451_05385 [Erythrobacter sp.]|nr:MAG: hypothetical protein JY451_05385 [Erythrobacter sp.]